MTFDDFAVGQVARFGRYEVTRVEVLAFAAAYDPQPFHLDDAAAAASPIFGRLAASGWHTAAMTMRMMVDHWQATGGGTSMGSPGLEELRWLRPVYPGDVLRAESEVIAVKPSASKPDRGAVTSRTTTFNQDDQPVLTFVATSFFARS